MNTKVLFEGCDFLFPLFNHYLLENDYNNEMMLYFLKYNKSDSELINGLVP